MTLNVRKDTGRLKSLKIQKGNIIDKSKEGKPNGDKGQREVRTLDIYQLVRLQAVSTANRKKQTNKKTHNKE